jgi:ABC-2 type transport system ATP-binding protein
MPSCACSMTGNETMERMFEARGLSKRFDSRTALDHVDLAIEGPGIIGLLGRNGCGKTTLMRHVTGLYLPTEGTARTLGTPVAQLGHDELIRIGFVPQEIRLLDWMTVEQQLEYVASFYPVWDMARQQNLLDDLALDGSEMVGAMSSGNRQKLAIVLAVCHHPRFLILDEPVSDLDPIVRSRLLRFLLDVLSEDEATILVSSHVLRDVERIVDHVVCLEKGRVVTNAALDDLKETWMEWLIRAPEGELPQQFDETYVVDQEISGAQARLIVRSSPDTVAAFRERYGLDVEARCLNLEEMFPWLIMDERS